MQLTVDYLKHLIPSIRQCIYKYPTLVKIGKANNLSYVELQLCIELAKADLCIENIYEILSIHGMCCLNPDELKQAKYHLKQARLKMLNLDASYRFDFHQVKTYCESLPNMNLYALGACNQALYHLACVLTYKDLL